MSRKKHAVLARAVRPVADASLELSVEFGPFVKSFPYAVTVSVFGGTAEYFALWFKNMGHERWFYWYVTGCILASLVVYATMPETRDATHMDE